MKQHTSLPAASGRALSPRAATSFEPLEDRRQLSATAAPAALDLHGQATLPNQFDIKRAGVGYVMGFSNFAAKTAMISDVSEIDVHGGTGVNELNIAPDVPTPVKFIAADGKATWIREPGTYRFAAAVADPGTPSPGPTQDATAPQAAITVADASSVITAGQTAQVEALASKLGSGEWTTAKIAWDFGDAGSRYNDLTGFNAAHVYDHAGTYSVTLTLTNDLGKTSTAHLSVTVKADDRRTIYVSADGHDTNDGLSPGSAVKSIGRANQLLASNTKVLFRAGDTFDTATGVHVQGMHDVTIGSYGVGERPVLYYNGPQASINLVDMNSLAANVTVQNLTFDSRFDMDTTKLGTPVGVFTAGKNVTVRGNQFLNVNCAVQSQAQPVGLLVQDNTAPSATGLRAYFVWGQGTDLVVLGNTVANSTREHIVRIEGATRVLIAYNNFSNLDRSAAGDPADSAKGAIVIHKGSYAYVAYNVIPSGAVGVGPLGGADGQQDPNGHFDYCVLEGNQIHSIINIEPGITHLTVEDNVVERASGAGLYVAGYDSVFKRIVSDLRIVHNTVEVSGTAGAFADFTGKADAITLDDNLFVAPHLIYGAYETANLAIADTALGSFAQIKDNVWPVPAKISAWAQGGEFYLSPSVGVQSGYLSPQEWSALKKPTGDVYENETPAAGGYSAKVGAATYGSQMTDKQLKAA